MRSKNWPDSDPHNFTNTLLSHSETPGSISPPGVVLCVISFTGCLLGNHHNDINHTDNTVSTDAVLGDLRVLRICIILLDLLCEEGGSITRLNRVSIHADQQLGAGSRNRKAELAGIDIQTCFLDDLLCFSSGFIRPEQPAPWG